MSIEPTTPFARRRAWVRRARDLRMRLRIAAVVLAAVGLAVHPIAAALGADPWPASYPLAIALFLLAGDRWRRARHATPAIAPAAALAVAAGLAAALRVAGPQSSAALVSAATLFLPAWAALVPTGFLSQLSIAVATLALLGWGLQAGQPSAPATAHALTAIALAAAISVLIAATIQILEVRAATRASERRRAAEERRRAARGQRERIANLSHDLRNPLAVALGYSDMAADGDLPDEERAQALARVKRSLWELTSMVENVLDDSADESGALALYSEAIEVGALCEDLRASVEILARGKPIAIALSVEPDMGVFADRQRLTRVLGNLLGNAVKYTERGEVWLRAVRSGNAILFEVRDTGPGIAPDKLPRIFDRYRQAHGSARGGVGLGLSIARVLTERMGGSLTVESAPGVGSCFSVRLPLAHLPRRADTSAAA